MRVLVPLVMLLALLSACTGAEKACTLIGTQVGVGVELDPAIAAKVTTGSLKLCWDGKCQTGKLDPANPPLFLVVNDLPLVEMQATLRFEDAAGATVVDQTLPVTAEQTYPNGPDCGAGGPQQQLVVDAGGTARVR